jgi:hypothetical protein
LIFAARLLPFPLKNQLIARVYRVRHDDIFPTYHRLNSATAIQNKLAGFTLTKLLFLSDLNFERKTVFLLLLLWHRLTLLTGWKKLRTNILAVLKKS